MLTYSAHHLLFPARNASCIDRALSCLGQNRLAILQHTHTHTNTHTQTHRKHTDTHVLYTHQTASSPAVAQITQRSTHYKTGTRGHNSPLYYFSVIRQTLSSEGTYSELGQVSKRQAGETQGLDRFLSSVRTGILQTLRIEPGAFCPGVKTR